MKEVLKKNLWNFIKFSILITIVTFISILLISKIDEILYMFTSEKYNLIVLDTLIKVHPFLTFLLLFFIALKKKYILFSKSDHLQNILNCVFMLLSFFWFKATYVCGIALAYGLVLSYMD